MTDSQLDPVIMLVHSVRPWARDFHRFVADHGGARVCGYAVSPESAVDAAYDVLFVDDVTSFLSPLLVGRLHERGVRVVGVYDPEDGDESGADLLRSYGVDAVIPVPAAPAQLVSAMLEVMPGLADAVAKPGAAPDSDSSPGHHPVMAVTGAAGGCGATELAIALAADVNEYVSAVLVDADTEHPGVAQRLGLALHPNLLTVCDRVLHRESAAGGFLHHRELGVPIIAGLPDASRWQTVSSTDITELLLALRQDRVPVINVGSTTDDLPGTGPGRFAVSRSVLALADQVVLTATADPVGVRRTIDWLATNRALIADKPVHLALNRCPGGERAQFEIEREVARNHRFASSIAVATDRRVPRAAWRASVPHRGPLRRASGRLAREIMEALVI